MKEKSNNWETDISQKVRDHEFSSDHFAWDEMSLLLDEAVMHKTDSEAGPDTGIGIGGTWKGILFTLFISGAIALSFLIDKKAAVSDLSNPSNIETLNSPLSPKGAGNSQQKRTVIKEQNTTKPLSITSDESQSKKTKTIDYQIPEQSIDTKKIDEAPKKGIKQKKDMSIPRPLLKRVKLLPIGKTTLTLEFIPEPLKIEIKKLKNDQIRDKNKLYPDVIDNY